MIAAHAVYPPPSTGFLPVAKIPPAPGRRAVPGRTARASAASIRVAADTTVWSCGPCRCGEGQVLPVSAAVQHVLSQCIWQTTEC